MTTSIPSRRPPGFVPSSSGDEEYINRSLLDSLDAQADAEPLSSSDSELAAAVPATSFGTSSSLSSSNILPTYIRSPPLNADTLNHNSQNTNTSHSLYNSMNNLSIFPSEHTVQPGEHDPLNLPHKPNGLAGPLRGSSSSFQSFSTTRARHLNSSLRPNTSISYGPPFGQSSQSDMFVPGNNLPPSLSSQQSSSFDSMQHVGRLEYSLAGSQGTPGMLPNGVPSKQSVSGTFVDTFRVGLDSAVSQQHLGKAQVGLNGPPGMLQDNTLSLQSQHAGVGPQSFQGNPLNASLAHSHGHLGPLQGQTAFGPSLVGPGQGSMFSNSSNVAHMNGAPRESQQQQQSEEISTIFVVGFPDDMTEREFQNMFTFCPGFEAATLKIPNKESTAYGTNGLPTGPNARAAGLPFQYGGSNDPYNVVTVNQGGVVIDGGRDGLTTSWPAPMQSADDNHFVPTMQPPRKQIIGFAKFRTRQEALEARDALQGRRVDVEKGSVLKAEMAKKNLHTKRGPGVSAANLPSVINNLGASGADGIASLNTLAGISGAGSAEVFNQRDRELGVLGAMGITGLGSRRDRLLEEEERRRPSMDGLGNIAFGPRGARERAEEDERERERKRREKEMLRLRQNSHAFEAFHSVPAQMVREGQNSLLTAETGLLDLNGPGYSASSVQQYAQHEVPATSGTGPSPWGSLRDVGASAALRKIGAPAVSAISTIAGRTSSDSPERSPPSKEAGIPSSPSGPTSASSQNDSTNPTSISAPFSPQSTSSSLPHHHSSSPVAAAQVQNEQQGSLNTSLPKSSGPSSISGSQNGHDDELAKAVGALAVSTSQSQSQSQGSTSPQLPSPASGASSATGRNSGDHNPPINTLYVGNLPTSPTPGGSPSTLLEERLRDLFSKRPGYRKLCFRQKSNGPMCFVEFEDVSFATQAIKDLSGNNLDGLVKGGGIRLSYSKNPLGVRTPTSAAGASSLQQQQSGQHVGSTAQQQISILPDSYQRQPGDVDTIRPIRRDTSGGLTSPTATSYHYTMSSPPPRFFNTAVSSTSPFASALTSPTTAMYPRASQGIGLSSSGFPLGNNTAQTNSSSSAFSPFGISPAHSSQIPDQPVTVDHNSTHDHTQSQQFQQPQHLSSLSPHVFSNTNNIESSRAS
ncbi:hypothetical protein K474DRAFT_1719325 [Panus rudis PR-1116 ss-1]|nr:hypothetical protein K474DRAFT_1719325 [Panus rudis PR-1116 ss-1]